MSTQTAITKKPAEMIVDEARANPITEHPFFKRMKSEPVNLTGLWSYYANLGEVTAKVPNWLSNLLIATPDYSLKCFVAHILNDELGSGNPKKIHCTLIDRMISGLSPWKPKGSTYDPLASGHFLAKAMEDFFSGDEIDINWAIGSLISGETYAEQMIFSLADEVRRQNELELSVFEWQLAHEAVEESHANDSLQMSQFVPERGSELDSVFQGANWKRETLWSWLDGIYQATYNETYYNN